MMGASVGVGVAAVSVVVDVVVVGIITTTTTIIIIVIIITTTTMIVINITCNAAAAPERTPNTFRRMRLNVTATIISEHFNTYNPLKPQTPNPKSQTLNPKPQTTNLFC